MGEDLEKPLLQILPKNSLYPNCPGCICAHLRSPNAPIPVKELLIVALLVVCNSKKSSTLSLSLSLCVRVCLCVSLSLAETDAVLVVLFVNSIADCFSLPIPLLHGEFQKPNTQKRKKTHLVAVAAAGQE
jgi:hypothetical protein